MKRLLVHILFLLSLQPLNVAAADLSIFGDLLVWHASEQTSASWANVVSLPTNRIVDFDATDINFNWDLGFRGGFIYEPKHSLEDTRLYWTTFRTKANSSLFMAEQLVIPEFFSGFLSGNVFFGGDLSWQLIMNMVDLDVGRKINIGKYVSIRPAIGIKGGTINQTINCNWDAAVYTSTEKVTNNFSGLGPSFGIDSKWHVYKNFNLLGNFSTALMWGKWKINDTYSRPSALLGVITPTTITTSLNDSKLGTIMLDYFLGLEWTYYGKAIIAVQVGYEMQFWVNQLRIPTFQQLPVHGDLTLQGGTCHIRIDL